MTRAVTCRLAPKNGVRSLAVVIAALISATSAYAESQREPDYLSIVQGAVPTAVGGSAALGANIEKALLAIDGDERSFSATPKPGGADSELWFLYRLPAATTFKRFAVPNVGETPSPSQTFFRDVEVSGGNDGPDGSFAVLGKTVLTTHASRGERTWFDATQRKPVTWVKVRLRGGIRVEREQMFFEFSELIGEGDQAPVETETAFAGSWRGRGVSLALRQDGADVFGCYDSAGELQGSVSGNVLRATGKDRVSGVRSAFVLTLADSTLTGVRSTNGAPFRLYMGSRDARSEGSCAAAAARLPGCGDTLYGVQFDFDSAAIRPESGLTLDRLGRGLQSGAGSSITIVGHTSAEGSVEYNRELSQRRAAAVVDALVARGLARERLVATGAGETQPIADNRSEAGRALNRRVEVRCQ